VNCGKPAVQRTASLGPHRKGGPDDQGSGKDHDDQCSIAHDWDGMKIVLNGA
jgi:hypothetical protein